MYFISDFLRGQEKGDVKKIFAKTYCQAKDTIQQGYRLSGWPIACAGFSPVPENYDRSLPN